jgi:hypothetical protein
MRRRKGEKDEGNGGWFIYVFVCPPLSCLHSFAYLIVGLFIVKDDDVIKGCLASGGAAVGVKEFGQENAELGRVQVTNEQDVGPKKREKKEVGREQDMSEDREMAQCI